ncbi:MAG: hypothetical protein HC773_30740, partial [Scytonema sp. CRU_2_7]|nr:hypothetical protein [Scytonema sp. CRU_2_7]
AAFAGQAQKVDQYTEQNGAAVNGSSTVQTSTTNSRQVQNARSGRSGYKYGHGYGRSGKVQQGQDARQTTVQNGAATDGSTTDQYSDTNNRQNQRAR